MKVLKLILIPLCVILMSASVSAEDLAAEVDALKGNKADKTVQGQLQNRILALEACLAGRCGDQITALEVEIMNVNIKADIIEADLRLAEADVDANATELISHDGRILTNSENWVMTTARVTAAEADIDAIRPMVDANKANIVDLKAARDIKAGSFLEHMLKLETWPFEDAVDLAIDVDKFYGKLEYQQRLKEKDYDRIGTTPSSASDAFLTNYDPLEVARIMNMRAETVLSGMDEIAALKPLERHDFSIYPKYAKIFKLLAYAPILAKDIAGLRYPDRPPMRKLVREKIKQEFHGFGKPREYSIAFLVDKANSFYLEYGLEPPFAIPAAPAQFSLRIAVAVGQEPLGGIRSYCINDECSVAPDELCSIKEIDLKVAPGDTVSINATACSGSSFVDWYSCLELEVDRVKDPYVAFTIDESYGSCAHATQADIEVIANFAEAAPPELITIAVEGEGTTMLDLYAPFPQDLTELIFRIEGTTDPLMFRVVSVISSPSGTKILSDHVQPAQLVENSFILRFSDIFDWSSLAEDDYLKVGVEAGKWGGRINWTAAEVTARIPFIK